MVWSQSIIQNRKITLGHDESGNSSGGDCRDDSVALLGNADLAMPPPVGLGGGEHPGNKKDGLKLFGKYTSELERPLFSILIRN